MRRRGSKRTWLLAAAALVVLGEGAFLVWHRRDPPLRYPEIVGGLVRRVDLDGDGVVSPAEYAAHTLDDEPFSAWDENGDGVLSPSELETQFLQEDPTRRMMDRALKARMPAMPLPMVGQR